MKILFVPRDGYLVTPLLFAANAVVFIIMALQFKSLGPFSSVQVIHWGANYGPLVKEGEWFRLLTSMFLHADVRHLFMNLSGLIFAGMMVERVVGSEMVAAIYFGAGVVASIAGATLHPQLAAIGASGAIFGLWGFLLTTMVIANFRRGPAMLPVLYFALYIGLNLAIGVKTPGVDNTAHLTGLFAGAVAGAVFRRKKRSRRRETSHVIASRKSKFENE